jgi:hypothetical protein
MLTPFLFFIVNIINLAFKVYLVFFYMPEEIRLLDRTRAILSHSAFFLTKVLMKTLKLLIKASAVTPG